MGCFFESTPLGSRRELVGKLPPFLTGHILPSEASRCGARSEHVLSWSIELRQQDQRFQAVEDWWQASARTREKKREEKKRKISYELRLLRVISTVLVKWITETIKSRNGRTGPFYIQQFQFIALFRASWWIRYWRDILYYLLVSRSSIWHNSRVPFSEKGVLTLCCLRNTFLPIRFNCYSYA